MTDKEIMQALNCCTSKSISCQKCPLLRKSKCERELIRHSFDLIKRQQAEIEKAKAEAIRYFAERLKYRWGGLGYESPDVDFDYFVDKLVDRMLGAENG